MPELGSAYYRIYADTRDFSRSIKKAEKDANAATTGVSKSLRVMDRDIDQSTERTHQLSSAFEVQKDEVSGLLVVYKKHQRTTKDTVKDTDTHERSVGRLSGAYSALRGRITDLGAALRSHKKDQDNFTKTNDKNIKGIFRFNQAVTLMGHIFKVIKFPAIIAGVGYLATALSAATAGVVAFTSALGPSVGVLGSIPQAASVAVQSLITLKLGFSGVKAALKDSMKDLQQPGPAAQKFADTLKGAIPGFKEFRDALQGALLPRVADGLKKISKNAGIFKKVFVGSGGAVGKVIQNLGGFLGSKGFGKDFAKLGASNNKIIGILGHSLVNIAHALTDVAIAARPLTEWLAKLTEKWTMNWRASAQAGRESGKTAKFFDKTRQVLTTLGHIVGNLGGALFNIGKASSKVGGGMLKDLEKLTGRWKKWTASVSGKNSLTKYFQDSKKPLYEFLGLMGDVVKMIFSVGESNNTGLTALFKQIRTDLLPVIQELVNGTTKNFGPVLINTIVELAKAFALLAGTNGPLVVMVKAIGSLAKGFNDLVEKAPGLRNVIFLMVGLAGAAKGLKLVGAITGITKLGSSIFGLTKIGTAMAEKGGFLKYIGLGGVGWIAAIAAAAAGIYLLYTKCETFRKIVDQVAAAIKVGFIAALNWTKKAVQDTIAEVSTWHTLFDIVKGVWTAIVTYLKFEFTVIKTVITVAFAYLKPIVTDAWEGIKQAFTGAITVITGLVKFWTGIFHGDFRKAWEGVKQIFRGALTYIVGLIRATTAPLRHNVALLWDGLKMGVSAAWDFVKGVFGKGIGALKAIISGAYGGMKSMGTTLFKKIGEGIAAAVGGVKSAFISAVNAVLGVAESFVNGIISIVNKLPFVPDFGPVHFPRIGSGGSNNAEPDRGSGVGTGKKTTLPGLAQGGAVTSPIVMMGEEAPQHHEWVIATNPAYRKQNVKYWAQAGQDLGVSGFAGGGLLGKVTGAVGGAASGAFGAAKSAAGGVLGGAAKLLLKALPGNPFGDYPMKDFAGGLLNSAGKKIGGNKALKSLGKMVDYGTSFGSRGTPYDYGGGHGRLGVPGAKGGFDCSGFVSAILGQGGLLGSPLDTVGLRSALTAGGGKYVTVGVRGGAGKSGHTMMKINDGAATSFFESGSGHGARKVGGWSGAFDMYHPQGFAKGGYFGKYNKRVTVKGQHANRSQQNILGRAIELANRWKVPYAAKKALVEAIIVESEAKNLRTPSADGYGSFGILQGRAKYHKKSDLLDPDYQIGAFLGHGRGGKATKHMGFTGKGSASRLARKNPKMGSGAIAQAVEGSAYPGRYATRGKEASRIIRAYRSNAPARKKTTAKKKPPLPKLTHSIGQPGSTEYRSVTGTGQGYTALRADLPGFYSNWYTTAKSTPDTKDDLQWMTAYLAYLRASVGSLVDMRGKGDPRFGEAFNTFWSNVDALQGLGAGLPGVASQGSALTNAVSGIAQFAINAGLTDPRPPVLADGDPGPEPKMPSDSGVRSTDYEAWLEGKWGQAQLTRDKSDDNAVLAKAHAYYDPRADYTAIPDWMKPPEKTEAEQLIAQRADAARLAAADTAHIDRLVGAIFGYESNGANQGGGTGGRGATNLIIQSYVPPTPAEAKRLADYTIGGIGYQNPRGGSVTPLGA